MMESDDIKEGRSGRAKLLAGRVLSIIQLVITVIFVIMVIRFAVLPAKYLAIIVVVLALLWLLCAFLMNKPEKKIRYILGAVLSVILSVVLAIGSVYLSKINNVLDNITGSAYELTVIGVYVLDEDPAETLEDAADYDFGILSQIGRDDTDNAVETINEELGLSITQIEYESMSDIADALYAGEAQAIILGDAYVDIITETDGYDTFEDDIRLIYSTSWETELEETDADDNVFTVLISGIDVSGSISTKSRSDVNILAVVNRNTHQVQLISTPRDYYVALSISNGVKDKLTHSGIYGIECTMDTLGILYDIDVDYYFRINFTGFTELIDAMGGVTVTSEVAFTTGDYSYVVGENYLDGDAALAFVRERKSFSDGDRQRGRNQMALITAVISQMQSLSFLNNFNSFLSGVESSFETNMSYDLISEMVKEQIAGGYTWNVGSYSVDGTGTYASTYSMSQELYVMVPDEDTVEYAKELIQKVMAGEMAIDAD